jgi:hypothetical protein
MLEYTNSIIKHHIPIDDGDIETEDVDKTPRQSRTRSLHSKV